MAEIQAKNRGPGPGAYMLPNLTGYDGHDVRKCRPPAYTMAARMQPIGKIITPGPKYYIEKNYTRFGKNGVPAYTMRPRVEVNAHIQMPGPGSHSPEQCPLMKETRPPVYSMSSRTGPRRMDDNPSPAQYKLPEYIGPNLPVKPSAAAYTLSGREKGVAVFSTPSPAQYNPTDLEIYKLRNPQYTMSERHQGHRDRTPRPGPAAYYPVYNPCRDAPIYSFGVKHSPYMKPMILECDN